MHLVGFTIEIITPALHKIQEYRRNWLQHKPYSPVTDYRELLKKLQTNRQKEPEETVNDTVRREGPERVNKWPNCVLAREWWWWLLLLFPVSLTCRLVYGEIIVDLYVIDINWYSDWLWAGRSGIESRWERDFPPVQTALGPTQPPVKWVPGLSRG